MKKFSHSFDLLNKSSLQQIIDLVLIILNDFN